MKAETFVKNPPQTLQDVVAEVQAVANHTQSEAWHLHPAGDGSIVEIRCAPDPKFRDELPEITQDSDGFLAEKGGKLYKAIPVAVETGSDPVELRKVDDKKKYRTLYGLVPGQDDPVYEGETVPEDGQHYALVEFEWVEVEPDWKEHAVKKDADVRLTAHTSHAVASQSARSHPLNIKR